MSDRHEKWEQVPPGTVIPAGQPYRVEWRQPEGKHGHDYPGGEAEFTTWLDRNHEDWFIDSSWKPPLVLPTEPTWGIAVITGHRLPYCNQWQMKHEQGSEWFVETGGITTAASGIVDFIPLTDEQVARIEAAR